jgi:hypothetical protein
LDDFQRAGFELEFTLIFVGRNSVYPAAQPNDPAMRNGGRAKTILKIYKFWMIGLKTEISA